MRVDPARLADAVRLVDNEVRQGTVPGAALVAIREGRCFLAYYRGTARTADGDQVPMAPGLLLPLFSFSKGISATVAVLAHQKGLIDYDLPVRTYVPEFTGDGREAITLRHLLTHAAGIPAPGAAPVATEEQWQAYAATVAGAQVEWPPGSRTAYHGLSGLFVVAEAIRRVTANRPWEAICREWLFDPIGARGFTFGTPPPDAAVALPASYFTSLEPGQHAMAGHPAAGAFGRVDDMLRLLHLIVSDGRWLGFPLIRRESLRQMLTVQYASQIAEAVTAGRAPAHEPWGLGWLVRGTAPRCDAGAWFGFGDAATPTLFGHAGVETVYGVGDPARRLAFVFVTSDKPRDADETPRLRREVSNLLQQAVLPR